MSREIKEIAFWRLQIEEHMLFIYQGLVDDLSETNLKQEAVTLHQAWHYVKDDDVMVLIELTLTYQKLILNISQHAWIGWLSVSFLEHIMKETEYFKKKLMAPLSMQEEVQFWLWHHESECAAAEKLLDPSEEELSKLIKKFIDQIKNLEKGLAKNKMNKDIKCVLNEYINQTTTLEDGILNDTILSNISPILINHVIREGYYALDLFTTDQ